MVGKQAKILSGAQVERLLLSFVSTTRNPIRNRVLVLLFAQSSVAGWGNCHPKASPQRQELENAGGALGVNVATVDISSPDDLVSAFQALANQRIDVVIVLQTSMLLTERQKIAGLAATLRMPAIYGYREHVVDGGLISYGVDLRDCFRRSATYVHKILTGAAPGDLPVEFPTKVELVINLKTAKALGLHIPATLLVRADEVIE